MLTETSQKERPKTREGHYHAEAFCLMWYACDECGHRERMWNSRDGVTPFGTLCPSCERPSLRHTDFRLDQYAPKHTPALGQRIWVAMTRERAEFIAHLRIKAAQSRGPLTITPERLKSLIDDIYEDGQTPDMRVVGYSEPISTGQVEAKEPVAVIKAKALKLTSLAVALKMNVTIERRPRPGKPLAMGNVEYVVEVWPARGAA